MIVRKRAVRLLLRAGLLVFLSTAVAGWALGHLDAIRIGRYEIEFDESSGEDSDGDGKVDKVSYYLRDSLVLTAWDEDGNGKAELWFIYDEEEYLVQEVADTDGDGRPDEFTRMSRDEKVVEVEAGAEAEEFIDLKKGSESGGAKNAAASAKVVRVIFEDDFNTEGGGHGLLNYRGFKNWEVTEGEVDLLGHGFWDYFPDHGLFIDMDGTQRPKEQARAGTLRAKKWFSLSPGTYRLSFDVAGNPHTGPNTLSVSMGELFSEDICVKKNAPFVTVMRLINVRSATRVRLEFRHHGGDWDGMIMDNVRLEQVQ